MGPHEVHTAAFGNGPVDALNNALLKALVRFYPRLTEIILEDYKVRRAPRHAGHRRHGPGPDHLPGRAPVVEHGGVATDIIDASWQALVDSITYKLFRDDRGQE